MHDAAQFVCESLSPHPEIGTHDRRPGGERRDPIHASGGDVAVSSKVDVELIVNNPTLEIWITYIPKIKTLVSSIAK